MRSQDGEPCQREKIRCSIYRCRRGFDAVSGGNACQQIDLITVNKENIRPVTAFESKFDLIDEYKDVFNDDVGLFPRSNASRNRSYGATCDITS